MKKNAIAIIAFAAVSSLSGFTDVSKTAERQQGKLAVSAPAATLNLAKFPDQTDARLIGRTNMVLSSWD